MQGSEPEPEPECLAGHVGNLSAEQSAAMEELRALAAQELASEEGRALVALLRGEDYLLARYLRGTAFVPAHAHRVLQKMLAWRKAQGRFLDDPERIAIWNRLSPLFTAGYHKHTSAGEVVELWRIGQIWPAEIVMNYPDGEAEQAFFFHTETSLQRQCALGERLGTAGTAASVLVLDLQGMGKRHLAPRGLALIAGLFATAQKVYVENVSKIYVVNTPKFFEVAFAVIRPVLDKRTVAKITVLPDSGAAMLGQMMGGLQHVPAFLQGGTDQTCTIGYPELGEDDWTATVAAGRGGVHTIVSATSRSDTRAGLGFPIAMVPLQVPRRAFRLAGGWLH